MITFNLKDWSRLPKITGIYSLFNTVTNKQYIGSASAKQGFYARICGHFLRLEKGKHHSKYLQNAYNKYGIDAFKIVILHTCTPEEAVGYEQYFIDQLHPEYNIQKSASSPLGTKHSQITIEKIRKANTGKKRSDEFKAKVRKARLGTRLSEVTKKKLSQALSGKNYGRKHSLSSREKMSKEFFFLGANKNLIKIVNLNLYAETNNLTYKSLWDLSKGFRKEYAGLTALPEVYESVQQKLKDELEVRKNTEWLYPNLKLSIYQGVVKYSICKKQNGRFIANIKTSKREKALEIALVLNQILKE